MTTQPTHLSVEEIAEGRKLLTLATKAPWHKDRRDWRDRPSQDFYISGDQYRDRTDEYCATGVAIVVCPETGSVVGNANADLIVFLRNHAPCLLAAATRDSEAKWIPVTERLPEPWTLVLLLAKDVPGLMVVGCYTPMGTPRHNDIEYEADSVSHWMPLPSPPDSLPKG